MRDVHVSQLLAGVAEHVHRSVVHFDKPPETIQQDDSIDRGVEEDLEFLLAVLPVPPLVLDAPGKQMLGAIQLVGLGLEPSLRFDSSSVFRFVAFPPFGS
jgi:hypothetical protein